MNEMLAGLKAYGADMQGITSRFLGDMDLYQTCFQSFVKDESFPKLGEALDALDYEKAFICAHTLKGITGNMGLTPLFSVVCAMVEALRNQEYSGLQINYAEVMEQLTRLKALQK